MLFNLFLALLLAAFATVVAYLINNRRTDSPSVPRSSLPIQIDRCDFEIPEKKWLLVFFSSESCASCKKVRELLSDLQTGLIHIQEVNFPEGKTLHNRYGIESVPIVLIADSEGVVIWSYAGVPPKELISDVIAAL
tara:strand:+ start:429 stop:836 length:408 start_codon:yes stop_codon:yes gene_type:complete